MDTQQVYSKNLMAESPASVNILSKSACILPTKDCVHSERKKQAFLLQWVINIKKEQQKVLWILCYIKVQSTG